MFKRIFWVLCWAVLALVSQFVYAESSCPEGLESTTDSGVYVEYEGGEILHIPSNLVFMRCALGQQWIDGDCIGEAEPYTWQQALSLSLGYQFNEKNSWRLPNIKELSVIVERACVRPAINEDVFPQTAIDDFWTSTPSMLDEKRAWSIAFANGSSAIKAKDRSILVRLVRTRLPEEPVE
ncbi:Lcl C-terminal domain-containing protein [Agaribacter flavus]|uniref:DUF1566 domain-containing protein n=1 Tax=Agaribacter flavus TaxID=1902781 RepID=A0ABV7FSQ3_9ALTE